MNSSALQQFNISRAGNEMVINHGDEFMEHTGGREKADVSMVMQLNDAYNINAAKIQIEAIDSTESKNRLIQVKDVLKNSKTLKE
jgi:hypothetical protein